MVENKFKFNSKVEFYITNVCNLTCENCNRFNNYQFKGYQPWADYSDVYRRWSQYIDLQSIVLMGGEPLLNPTVKDWALGLTEIFHCDVQILTNGFQLNRVPGLYDAVLSRATDRAFVFFEISLHNLNDFEHLRQQCLQFLAGPVTEWGKVFDRPAPQGFRNFNSYYSVQDSNYVLINMHIDNSFYTAAIQRDHRGKFVVNKSDPEEAHSRCGFVKYKSYHFMHGALHKCGPAPLFPEFDRQHGIELSDEDRMIMHSYQPYTIELIEQQGIGALANLDRAIPQCRFCPTEFSNTVIWPVKKSQK